MMRAAQKLKTPLHWKQYFDALTLSSRVIGQVPQSRLFFLTSLL